MCKRCQTCQKTARGSLWKAKLVPLPVIEVPFTRIAIDMVGPSPRTEEGHQFILTIVDYGLRFPDAIPLKTTTSQDVAEALLEYFSRVGLAEEILTDRGSNFTSDLMEKLYQMLRICGNRTSADHPQTDGMGERYNATLKAGLKKMGWVKGVMPPSRQDLRSMWTNSQTNGIKPSHTYCSLA